MNQKISIVVAIAKNNAIGKNNQLLWHLPNDLKHFKEITSGGTVIMGRKTYESIGKPLPKRRNIVITRQEINIDGCEVVHTIDEAFNLCANEEEVFLIGGAEIYKQAMEKVDRIYLTIVDHEFEADAYFPEIDCTQWNFIHREDHQPDEKHQYPYSFLTLERR